MAVARSHSNCRLSGALGSLAPSLASNPVSGTRGGRGIVSTSGETTMNAQPTSPTRDGGPSPAGRSGQRQGRRWFLKMLVALAVGDFAAGGTAHAQGGPGGGGGGNGIPDLVGTWVASLPLVNGGVQVTL